MKPYYLLLLPLFFSCSEKKTAAENNSTRTITEKKQVIEEAKPLNSVGAIPAPVPRKTQVQYSFDKAEVGSNPAGWSSQKTGSGEGIVWVVVQDGKDKVLGQLTKSNPSNQVNVITLDSLSAKNIHLQTRFKSVSGKTGDGGGLVWRYQNPDNYYLMQVNSSEDSVMLYKVRNGKRTHLPLMGKGRTYGSSAKVPANTWHDLEMEARNNLFTVSVNGQELFRVNDATFPKAGKVGFWTKAGAATYFDDLQIDVLP